MFSCNQGTWQYSWNHKDTDYSMVASSSKEDNTKAVDIGYTPKTHEMLRLKLYLPIESKGAPSQEVYGKYMESYFGFSINSENLEAWMKGEKDSVSNYC